MMPTTNQYIDVQHLRQRGWTRTLIHRFLGAPDRWQAVDHWKNYTGKRTYFLERVQFAEASGAFHAEFLKSIRRRKLSEDTVDGFFRIRKATADDVRKWRASLTGDDIRRMRLVEELTGLFKDLRRHGYRTPHKA